MCGFRVGPPVLRRPGLTSLAAGWRSTVQTVRRVAAGVALSTAFLFAIVVSAKRRAPRIRQGGGSAPFLANVFAAAVVAYLVVAAGLVAWAILQRRRQGGSERRAARGKVVWTFVAFIALLTFAARLRRTPGRHATTDLAPVLRPPKQPAKVFVPHGLDLTWGFRGGLVIVGLGAVAMLFAARRAKRNPNGAPLPRETALTASLDELLAAMHAENDPRRAVLLAYAGLEHALAQHGIARNDAQTAHEYLAAVSQHLSLSQESLTDLTHLSDLALFSAHTINSTMRQRAIDGLERVRNELAGRSHAVCV